MNLRINGKMVNDDVVVVKGERFVRHDDTSEYDADREDQMVPVLPPDLLSTRQGIYEDEAAWANPSYKKKPPSRRYFGLAKPWATSRAGNGGGAAAGGRSGGKGKKGRV